MPTNQINVGALFCAFGVFFFFSSFECKVLMSKILPATQVKNRQTKGYAVPIRKFKMAAMPKYGIQNNWTGAESILSILLYKLAKSGKPGKNHFYEILYFLGYIFFSFQNNPKNPDPSYEMDLDLWDF